MTDGAPLFRFVQFEFPWPLGPDDGRYLVRAPDRHRQRAEHRGGRHAAGEDDHVVVVATLSAPRRRLLRGRRRRAAALEGPDAVPVTTSRVTVVDARPSDAARATRWLEEAGADAAGAALRPVRRLVRAHRIASADPDVPLPHLARALVVRVGYGAGELVADGRWDAARELPDALVASGGRRGRRRRSALGAEQRAAALATGRAPELACEQLALDARRDLDDGELVVAALGLAAALRAAAAELPTCAEAARLGERIAELRTLRDEIAPVADRALDDGLPPAAAERLAHALARLEAALRARAAAMA